MMDDIDMISVQSFFLLMFESCWAGFLLWHGDFASPNDSLTGGLTVIASYDYWILDYQLSKYCHKDIPLAKVPES